MIDTLFCPSSYFLKWKEEKRGQNFVANRIIEVAECDLKIKVNYQIKIVCLNLKNNLLL